MNKNNMMFRFFAAAAFTLCLGAGASQARAGGFCGDLSSLDLTEEQQAEIESLRDGARQRIRELRDNDELTREERREQARAIRQQTKEEIEGVLTPEQRQQLEDEREARRKARLDRKVERLTERLSLDTDQALAVRGILESASDEARSLKADFEGTREELRAELQALRDRTRGLISDQLNDEQREIFEAMSQRRRRRAGAGRR